MITSRHNNLLAISIDCSDDLNKSAEAVGERRSARMVLKDETFVVIKRTTAGAGNKKNNG
jgi:hypothetical protein